MIKTKSNSCPATKITGHKIVNIEKGSKKEIH